MADEKTQARAETPRRQFGSNASDEDILTFEERVANDEFSQRLASEGAARADATMTDMSAQAQRRRALEAKRGMLDKIGGREPGYLGETMAPETLDKLTAPDRRSAQNHYLHDQQAEIVAGDEAQAARQSGALFARPENDPTGSLIGPPPDAEVPGSTKSAYAGRYSDPMLLQRQHLLDAGMDITAEDEALAREGKVQDAAGNVRDRGMSLDPRTYIAGQGAGMSRGGDEVVGRTREKGPTWQDERVYDAAETADFTPDYMEGNLGNLRYFADRNFADRPPRDLDTDGDGWVSKDEAQAFKDSLPKPPKEPSAAGSNDRTQEGAAIDRAVNAATAPKMSEKEMLTQLGMLDEGGEPTQESLQSQALQSQSHLQEWKDLGMQIGLDAAALASGNPVIGAAAVYQHLFGEPLPRDLAREVQSIPAAGAAVVDYMRTTPPSQASFKGFRDAISGAVRGAFPEDVGPPWERAKSLGQRLYDQFMPEPVGAGEPAEPPAGEPRVTREALIEQPPSPAPAESTPPAGSARPEVDTFQALGDIVAATESGPGGDPYKRLYGNAERGDFAGVDVSNMTLGELKAFTDPRTGPYAEWSMNNPDIGRVATPMGRYQIVGKTLRGLQDTLGLPDDTVFTPEVQDQMFRELVNEALRTPDPVRALKSTWAGLARVSDAELRAALGMRRPALRLPPGADPETGVIPEGGGNFPNVRPPQKTETNTFVNYGPSSEPVTGSTQKPAPRTPPEGLDEATIAEPTPRVAPESLDEATIAEPTPQVAPESLDEATMPLGEDVSMSETVPPIDLPPEAPPSDTANMISTAGQRAAASVPVEIPPDETTPADMVRSTQEYLATSPEDTGEMISYLLDGLTPLIGRDAARALVFQEFGQRALQESVVWELLNEPPPTMEQ